MDKTKIMQHMHELGLVPVLRASSAARGHHHCRRHPGRRRQHPGSHDDRARRHPRHRAACQSPWIQASPRRGYCSRSGDGSQLHPRGRAIHRQSRARSAHHRTLPPLQRSHHARSLDAHGNRHRVASGRRCRESISVQRSWRREISKGVAGAASPDSAHPHRRRFSRHRRGISRRRRVCPGCWRRPGRCESRPRSPHQRDY